MFLIKLSFFLELFLNMPPTQLYLSSESQLDFVKEIPEEVKCSYHGGILQDPVVGQCGHSFCRSCVEASLQELDVVECPLCSEPISHPLYPNNLAIAVISKIKVRCHFSKECQQIIPLGELSVHKNSCKQEHHKEPSSPRGIYKCKMNFFTRQKYLYKISQKFLFFFLYNF